jgi:hypothetical protein
VVEEVGLEERLPGGLALGDRHPDARRTHRRERTASAR